MPTIYSIQAGIGITFSRPVGLTENVRFYLGDEAWIYQIEGMHPLKPYLAEYAKCREVGQPVPFLVAALNCVNGCNMGTATAGNLAIDDINYHTDHMKRAIDPQDAEWRTLKAACIQRIFCAAIPTKATALLAALPVSPSRISGWTV